MAGRPLVWVSRERSVSEPTLVPRVSSRWRSSGSSRPSAPESVSSTRRGAVTIGLVRDARSKIVRSVIGSGRGTSARLPSAARCTGPAARPRSEEHTSELQSRRDLVCRLLLEKKKKKKKSYVTIKKKKEKK